MSNTSAKSPSLVVTTVLSRSLRLAVILVIGVAGLMLLQTYRAMLHDSHVASSQKTSEKADERDPIAPEESIALSLLRPGAWSLGESNWSLGLTDLSAADDSRLQALGRPITHETKISTLEAKVLGWLKQVRPVVVDGCRVYNAVFGSVRIRVVSEKRGGRERLRLAQLIMRQGQSVQLLEASPAPTATEKPANDGHLLPLPAGVASLARRWDDNGLLACEIVGPTTRLEDALQSWSAAGWSSRKVHETEEAPPMFLLSRGGRTVHVCSLQTGKTKAAAYLLLSAGSNTN
jgi:hypothetical protein